LAVADIALASGQPIGDILAAPLDVVEALVLRLRERKEEQEKHDRQARLRQRLNKQAGR
jgi:hypothetical protein